MKTFLRTVLGSLTLALTACSMAQGFNNVGTTYPLTLSDLKTTFALTPARIEHDRRLREDIVKAIFSLPDPTTTSPKALREAMWAAGLMQIRTPEVRSGLRRVLRTYPKHSSDTQRWALETAKTLFPTELVDDVRRVSEQTTTSREFAMASVYLMRARGTAREWPRLQKLMTRKFDDATTNPRLVMLEADAKRRRFDTKTDAFSNRPDLSAFLAPDFAKGHPVVYSFQRPQRSYPGLAVVRRGDGKFVRTENGSIFNVVQLARSRSDNPGYVTNGNTPQGIFTVTGIDVTQSLYIGQTPFLWSQVPFEASPAEFFHDVNRKGAKWSLEMYRELLPDAPAGKKSWREDFGILEAYYAGEAGRSEMLAHGTVISPDYYTADPWYPNTPSSGCLCTKEIWDGATGTALSSDQLALMKAFVAASLNRDSAPSATEPVPPQPRGFLVVVELENAERPVTLDDVLMPILNAETRKTP